jgi:hypothetical protein
MDPRKFHVTVLPFFPYCFTSCVVISEQYI